MPGEVWLLENHRDETERGADSKVEVHHTCGQKIGPEMVSKPWFDWQNRYIRTRNERFWSD
jgi:hypothetical protein